MKRTMALILAASSLILAGCSPDANNGAITPKPHAPTWLTNGLIAFYPFDGNANDASGNRFNGTAHNTITVPDHLSNPDSAYRLNGADAYIYFGPVLPDMQTVTVTAWVKSSGGGTFFADADWQIANDFTIKLGPSGTAVRCDKSPTPSTPGFDETIPLATEIQGIWRNIAWVVMTNLVQVYVDGDLKGSVSIQSAGNVAYHDFIIGTEEFPQGTMGWNGYWKGDVSSVRIYNRALSADEARQLYAYESQGTLPLKKAKIAPSKKAAVTRWEYKVVDAAQWSAGLPNPQAWQEIYQRHLNDLGKEGWELVTETEGRVLYFKRPLAPGNGEVNY